MGIAQIDKDTPQRISCCGVFFYGSLAGLGAETSAAFLIFFAGLLIPC